MSKTFEVISMSAKLISMRMEASHQMVHFFFFTSRLVADPRRHSSRNVELNQETFGGDWKIYDTTC